MADSSPVTTPAGDPLSERAHRNYVESSRCFARFAGAYGAIEETDGLVLCASGSPFPALLNVAWRVNGAMDADEALDRADRWFGRRDRGYTVNVRDGFDHDDDLRTAAEEHGMIPLLGSPEMVCRRRIEDTPDPDGVELRWVADRATLEDFVTVNDAAYQSLGMTPGVVHQAIRDLAAFTANSVHSVVAYDDEQPLAAAQGILSDDIAGIYWVGVLDAARGRGLGEAVTRAVTNRAFDEGATASTLQASSMGEALYDRMGYDTLYRYTGYVKLNT